MASNVCSVKSQSDSDWNWKWYHIKNFLPKLKGKIGGDWRVQNSNFTNASRSGLRNNLIFFTMKKKYHTLKKYNLFVLGSNWELSKYIKYEFILLKDWTQKDKKCNAWFWSFHQNMYIDLFMDQFYLRYEETHMIFLVRLFFKISLNFLVSLSRFLGAPWSSSEIFYENHFGT